MPIKTLQTVEDYLVFVKTSKKGVINFTSRWCGPCLTLDETYEKLAAKFDKKIDFAVCDADKALEIADLAKIRGMPTLKLYKDGLEHKVFVGTSALELENALTNLG